jgi:peptidoglycan hydrolase-like protein with peptidoglycan-binding domain
MHGLKHIRTLALTSALVLGGAMAASAAGNVQSSTAYLPETVPNITGTSDIGSDASVAEVRNQLQALGFHNIGEIEQSGDIYTTEAQWQGRWVELRIDGENGGITYENIGEPIIRVKKQEGVPVASTETELTSELQRVGYDNVSNIEASGNVITADATHYGRQVSLSIDAETGAVSEE